MLTNGRRLYRSDNPHVTMMQLNLKAWHLWSAVLLLRCEDTRGRHVWMLRLWLEYHLLLLDAVLMHQWRRRQRRGTTFTS